MFKYFSLLFFLTLIFLIPSFALSSIPSQNGQKEKADTVIYVIDTINSNINWSCDLHHGFIPLERGTLKVVNDSIVAGRIMIKMDSITDTDIDYELMRKTLLNTLRSKQFLNTEKYHYATFIIDQVDYSWCD